MSQYVRRVCSQEFGLFESVLAHHCPEYFCYKPLLYKTELTLTHGVLVQNATSVFNESRITDVVSPTGDLPAKLTFLVVWSRVL